VTNAYSFLPWLRSGLATRITTDPGTAARASVPVKLRLTGDGVSGGTITQDVERTVQIYGPGDVIGVESRAVSRAEPRPWITNVEPNYLAHVEFYDEDLPWRYSPAVPDAATGRLAPWLALVVLAGSSQPGDDSAAEFTEGAQPGRPLPFITVLDPAETLPPPGQLGAWAHVHVDGGFAVPVASDDMATVLPALGQLLRTAPDRACSRLICPRHLEPDLTYHAFLVPAFETGRLAGLGLDPAGSPGALHPAWGPDYPGRPAPGQLPYYYRWFFGTGAAGDFEYLVRLLQPREPDPRVARRDIDVHLSAGPGLPPIVAPAGLGGVLRLGGALRVPKRPRDIWDDWDDQPTLEMPYPHPFQEALADLINLAEAYTHQTPAAAHTALAAGAPAAHTLAGEVDPIITPPLYGRWHARTDRLLSNADGSPIPAPANRNWVHRLNLDPRFRVAAGFGTQIVQRRQEEFMAAAWAQVGDVLAANARIRAAQLAREVGHALQAKHLEPGASGAAARAAAAPTPAAARALTLTAPANARVTTAGVAAFASAASGLGERVAVGFQVATSRIAAAPVSPAMRRITRPGSRLMRSLPFTAEQPPEALLPRMDADDGAVTAAPPKTTPPAVVTPERLDDVLHPPGPRLAAVAAADPVGQLPTSADFRITVPEDEFTATPGGADSPDAVRFKAALRDLYQGYDVAAASGRVEPRAALGVDTAAGAMLDGLRADRTVPKSLLSSVVLPRRLVPFAERFLEAMAYPVIDLPMYQALRDFSTDAFVPNLNLIPPNSITLLETDQEFIEAFMVGLNHELARELLWREYPTDQRGSPFRQFWDPRTDLALPGEDPKAQRERLYDITPIDQWSPASGLGQHDNRETDASQDNELVLVIRGELLKKYPTAAIYAHKAAFADGDPTRERELADVPEGEHAPRGLVRLPRYEAKVEPDIYLLGFDLTADEALGDVPRDPGWFFVIKERPGDPRFGLDLTKAPRVEVWNDLSWPDVDPSGHGFITLEPPTRVDLAGFDGSDDDPEKQDQRLEDAFLPLWHSGLSSADLAYILFQAPVLMAVHAQEMLPDA